MREHSNLEKSVLAKRCRQRHSLPLTEPTLYDVQGRLLGQVGMALSGTTVRFQQRPAPGDKNSFEQSLPATARAFVESDVLVADRPHAQNVEGPKACKDVGPRVVRRQVGNGYVVCSRADAKEEENSRGVPHEIVDAEVRPRI